MNTNQVLTRFLFAVGDNLLTLAWCEIDPDEFEYIRDNPKYYNFWVFQGVTAKIIVCAPKDGLNREKALKMASSFVSGSYTHVTLNPKGFDPYSRNGEPLIHPPY